MASAAITAMTVAPFSVALTPASSFRRTARGCHNLRSAPRHLNAGARDGTVRAGPASQRSRCEPDERRFIGRRRGQDGGRRNAATSRLRRSGRASCGSRWRSSKTSAPAPLIGRTAARVSPRTFSSVFPTAACSSGTSAATPSSATRTADAVSWAVKKYWISQPHPGGLPRADRDARVVRAGRDCNRIRIDRRRIRSSAPQPAGQPAAPELRARFLSRATRATGDDELMAEELVIGLLRAAPPTATVIATKLAARRIGSFAGQKHSSKPSSRTRSASPTSAGPSAHHPRI